MLEAIRYNLAHLADFRGREDRPTFWWYVLFLVILNFVLGLIAVGPILASSISAGIHAAQTGVPKDQLQVQVLHQMSGQIIGLVWISTAIKLLIMVLSVAAFVRRLHDSDNSGWWAALAVAVHVAVLGLGYVMVGGTRDVLSNVSSAGDLSVMVQQQQASMRWLGLLGWIAPVVVIVFGIMKSTPGPNRYGKAPQAA